MLVLLALLSPAHAGVVINEALTDPSGSDGGNEWLELYNNGGSAVDLSGATIYAGTSSYALKYTFPAATSIAGGDFLVVADELVVGADLYLPTTKTLGMGNGSSSDAVQLRSSTGSVLDTLIYSTPNTDLWEDDSSIVAISLAPNPASGSSVGRAADGVDTNACGADFTVQTPTMGAPNTSSSGGSCTEGANVVINEFVYDTDAEWVELYNAGNAALDVSGYALAMGTSSFSGRTVLPDGTSLAAHDFLLIGHSGVPGLDVVDDSMDPGNASNSDGIRVEDCAGTVLDTVIYGTPNSDGWSDDSGSVATSLAPKPASGQSIARVDDGVDTDASAVDFRVAAAPTPGISNAASAGSCDEDGEVVINELSFETDNDWIELYNAGDASLDLSGYALAMGTSSYSIRVALPDGTVLASHDWLLVGQPVVPDVDVPDDGIDLGNASDADGVRLEDCAGTVVDTVVYGTPNDNGWTDDTGEVATSLAPKPPAGASLQRVVDGYDTDQSGDDFAIQEAPTPGAANPDIQPDPCVPSAGDIVINELLADPDGADGGLEWFELYNNSDADVSISGWWIATASDAAGQADQDVLFGPGTRIPAGGFFVVGGASVDGADLVKTFTLGNGSGGEALVLLDCEGGTVDTVIYGDSNSDELVDDAGVVVPAYADAGSAQSIARVDDGVDNDVASDWKVDPSPSLGETNYQEPIVDTDPLDGPGGGCGGGNPDGGGCGHKAPDGEVGGGCMTLPAGQLGALGWALAIVLIRRSRRA
jgi:hypothetical protein